MTKVRNSGIAATLLYSDFLFFLYRWMLLNSSTGDVILVRRTEPPEKVSEIQFSPGKHLQTCQQKKQCFSFMLLMICLFLLFVISSRPLIETTHTFQMELISLWAAMITIFTFMNCKMKGSRSRLKHVARLERTI